MIPALTTFSLFFTQAREKLELHVKLARRKLLEAFKERDHVTLLVSKEFETAECSRIKHIADATRHYVSALITFHQEQLTTLKKLSLWDLPIPLFLLFCILYCNNDD